ncbi:hypothetical protein C0Z01_07025 [Photobacterium kishitanii]|uniref:hypothetical protein n=1 Tax=Photobacterium kishitanii TaxID=318456 RepID=UPI00043140A0|nr:hypothetical protein [Photobacterium kishitanii]PSU94707.1 hypothetical protein C0W35_08640 [Photobacterium kishitanii]PSW70302.1 hypothetical protein C0Z01_07025 [Photobacterium kishitanii]CEO38754.1 conserved exported hypothetical protein [Photobacterium kishitanii]
MNTLLRCCGVIVLLFSLNSCGILTTNKSSPWVRLTTQTANFNTDNDNVTLDGLSAKKFYNHLRVTCARGTVNIKKIKINYENGEFQQFRTAGLMTKDSISPPQLLDYADSKITAIEINYHSLGNKKLLTAGITPKAIIEVWGKEQQPIVFS